MQMQKVVSVLEQHVQWIALGLGGIYLGWMAYGYLVNPPITVKLANGKVATPADVDEFTYTGPTKQLEEEIQNKQPVPIDVKPVQQDYVALLGEQRVTVATLNNAWGGTIFKPGKIVGPENPTGVQVTAVAALPPAMPEATSTGMTVTDTPPQPPAGGNGVPPVPPNPSVQQVALRQDLTYVSVTATISQADLAKAFTEAYGKAQQPAFFQTMFVNVELLREEQQPGGTWGKPTVIPPLPIYDFTPLPVEGKAQPQEFFEYKAWAEDPAVQGDMVHPAFYPTAPDSPPWIFPGETPPQAVIAPGAGGATPVPAAEQRAFDPARDTPRNDQERQMKQQFEYQRRMLLQQQQMQQRGAAGRGAVGRGGYPAGNAYPGNNPYAVGAPGRYAPSPRAGTTPPPSDIGSPRSTVRPAPVYNPTPGFGNPQFPFNGNNAGGGVGAGAGPFMADQLLQDIQILAHDTTVKEGRTYRYAIRYRLFNPVFNAGGEGIVAPEPRKQFAMVSPDPADPKNEKLWTKPVALETHTRLFVTKINAQNGQADFDVFDWKDGRWHQSTAPHLTPGDAIASGQKTLTGWTVVDVRNERRTGSKPYVIVMDDRGNLQRRDVDSDQGNADYQRLKSEAGAAASAR